MGVALFSATVMGEPGCVRAHLTSGLGVGGRCASLTPSGRQDHAQLLSLRSIFYLRTAGQRGSSRACFIGREQFGMPIDLIAQWADIRLAFVDFILLVFTFLVGPLVKSRSSIFLSTKHPIFCLLFLLPFFTLSS